MSLTTHTNSVSFHMYRIEPTGDPLPCVLCGRKPEPTEPVLEVNRGEPRLLCLACAVTFSQGHEDILRCEQGLSGVPW